MYVKNNFVKKYFGKKELYKICLSKFIFYKENGPDTAPSTSTIDHFIITPNLKKSVVQYETIPLHNNFSDHIPLLFTLNIDIEFHKTQVREIKPSIAWYKCINYNITQYLK